MTWGQDVCYASLHSELASALDWGNLRMARSWEMSTLQAGYIPQRKVTSASSSGSLGFIECLKYCRMVDSVPRWQLPLSRPLQSSVDRSMWWFRIWGRNITQYRSWVWKIIIIITYIHSTWDMHLSLDLFSAQLGLLSWPTCYQPCLKANDYLLRHDPWNKNPRWFP